jgi:thiol:disulfide interchange protein DsbC
MKRFFLICVAVLTGYAGSAYGFGTGELGCSGDCTACHKVTRQEAQDVVRKLNPALTVEEVTPAPVRGLYQIVISQEKGKGIVYMDFAKRYLIQGTIIDTGNKMDLTSQSMRELLESQIVDTTRISLKNALILGNPRGTKRLYLFSDPDCPFCPKMHEEVAQLVKSMPDLAVYILLFPLDMHPDAAWKTNAIIAASKKDMKAAVRMLEDSYQKKAVKKNPAAEDYASVMKKMGQDLGIGSTPLIVYANGRIGMGFKPKEEIRAALEKNVPKQ